MRQAMVRLADVLARRRWFVIAAWLVAVAIATPYAIRQTENLKGGGFDVPGSESKVVEDATQTGFAEAQRGRLAAVVKVDARDDSQAASAALERLRGAVQQEPMASLPAATERTARAQFAEKGVAVVPLMAQGTADELIDTARSLREDLSVGDEVDGATTYLTGQPAMWAGFQELSKDDLEQAEGTGFPIVALILIAVFGSLAAASLPLTLGIVSVLITGSVIYLLSLAMDMSVFVTNMASMVGIGVAVDYSLFILARFREEVRSGKTATEARTAAMSTSGLAVTFSGMAVVISLAGLWMVDNQALRSMALGAMVVVTVAVLTAISLLPALIRVLGHRVEAGGVAWNTILFWRRIAARRRRPGITDPNRHTFWERWARAVMRRPILSVTLSSAILLTLAIPVLSIKTGNGAIEQFPRDYESRVGTELAAEVTGGGTDAVRILARFSEGDLETPANAAATRALIADLRADPEVRRVGPPFADGRDALIEAIPRHAAESAPAIALVDRLRDQTIPASALADRGTVSVGGEGARIDDARVQIEGSMWRIIAFVLAFSFVVLMVMLRSIILPLKAILMNLLSIGAAYGVLIAVFQWGWLDGFLGFQSLGELDTLTPPLVLAVVFGLSMDYEVFLLSRVRERFEEHGDNTRAVAEALSSSARTISSAALIMTAVFGVFVLTGVPSIKELGLGNAVAIALDATLVRLILVPAAMQLLGGWNWWLPGWLDRILPDLGFEREHRVPTRPAEA